MNTGGGTKGIGDFPLFVDTTAVTSGVENTFTIGPHTVSETRPELHGGDRRRLRGQRDHHAGGRRREGCTITNTFNAPG